MSKFPVGQVDGMCGKAAYEYIAKSIELDRPWRAWWNTESAPMGPTTW